MLLGRRDVSLANFVKLSVQLRQSQLRLRRELMEREELKVGVVKTLAVEAKPGSHDTIASLRCC